VGVTSYSGRNFFEKAYERILSEFP
jgi:hypothetical protein